MVLNVEHRHMRAALGWLQCSRLYLFVATTADLIEQLRRAHQHTELLSSLQATLSRYAFMTAMYECPIG